MSYRVVILAFFAVASGCSSTDLRRLAPPGIIKYEKIAEKKEPNPAITEEISDYQTNTKAKFPKLGRTPAGRRDRNIPGNRSDGAVSDVTTSLVDQRDKLLEAVGEDEAAAHAERVEIDDLTGSGAELANKNSIAAPSATDE